MTVPVGTASSLTHPILLPGTDLLAFIDNLGSLAVSQVGQIVASYDVNALTDARLLTDDAGRIMLLTGATDQYDHGVLGDAIEASGIMRIDNPAAPEISFFIPIPDDLDIEGISAIWTDITSDGIREIIVTLSNAQQGAQLAIFNDTGELIATSPAIGRGYRWRHQIAVAPFGPNGELELVDVLIPHLGGAVEFFHLKDTDLQLVAQVPGFTSHVIDTRNLDMAAAGDFDGERSIELLLPNQQRTELGAIRRTINGAEVIWGLSLNGKMVTNLEAVTFESGDIAVGVGREDGILQIWHP